MRDDEKSVVLLDNISRLEAQMAIDVLDDAGIKGVWNHLVMGEGTIAAAKSESPLTTGQVLVLEGDLAAAKTALKAFNWDSSPTSPLPKPGSKAQRYLKLFIYFVLAINVLMILVMMLLS